MPGRTNSTARAAAARFWASTSIAIETADYFVSRPI
jgi:hypothetical protein